MHFLIGNLHFKKEWKPKQKRYEVLRTLHVSTYCGYDDIGRFPAFHAVSGCRTRLSSHVEDDLIRCLCVSRHNATIVARWSLRKTVSEVSEMSTRAGSGS
jgi:hypothetical protein